jgi:hypothetical protein
MLPEHPNPELHVEPGEAEFVEKPKAARSAGGLAVSFSVSELEVRPAPGLVRRQPFPLEIRGSQIDVPLELLPHLGFEGVPAEEAAEEGTDAGKHQPSCGLADSARAMASAKEFQLATSSPNWRRPAFVRL